MDAVGQHKANRPRWNILDCSTWEVSIMNVSIMNVSIVYFIDIHRRRRGEV
jgi:hypothetical protein